MSKYKLLVMGYKHPVVEEDPSSIHPGDVERSLIGEVLKRAINDAVSGENSDSVGYRSEKREARQWIFSNEEIAPFSFYWICDHLSLNPERLRDQVRRLMSRAQRLPRSRRPRSDWVYYLNRIDNSDKSAA